MTQKLFLSLLVVILFSCNAQQNDQQSTDPPDTTTKVDSSTLNVSDSDTGVVIETAPPAKHDSADVGSGSKSEIEILWDSLAHRSVSACLLGGQYGPYVDKVRERNREMVFYRFPEWQTFFDLPKKDVTKFLVSQFADTSTSSVHTCPFYPTRTGELAVYALQHIYKINWYDFPEFSAYKDRQITSAIDCHQTWLWDILDDPKQRWLMELSWLKQLEH